MAERINFEEEKLSISTVTNYPDFHEELTDELAIIGVFPDDPAELSMEDQIKKGREKVKEIETKSERRSTIESISAQDRTNDQKEELKNLPPGKSLIESSTAAKKDVHQLEDKQTGQLKKYSEVEKWIKGRVVQKIYDVFKEQRTVCIQRTETNKYTKESRPSQGEWPSHRFQWWRQ